MHPSNLHARNSRPVLFLKDSRLPPQTATVEPFDPV